MGDTALPPSPRRPRGGGRWAPAGKDTVSSRDVVAAEVGGSAWEEEAQIPESSPASRGAGTQQAERGRVPPAEGARRERPPVLTSHLAPICGGPGEKGAGRSQVLFSKAALGSGRRYQGLTGPCLRAGSWLPACNSLSFPLLCDLRVKSPFLFSPCHRFCPWSAL